jgi:uncharacterized membrane protein
VQAFAAMAALVLELVQFAELRERLPQRILGETWVTLMAIVAICSFWIHGIR